MEASHFDSIDLESVISLTHIKPHPRPSLSVVKDPKTNNFFVIKVYDSEYSQEPLLSEAISRAKQYKSIKFASLQKIYQIVFSETTNFTLIMPYRSLLSLKRRLKYKNLVDDSKDSKLRLAFKLISSIYALHQNDFVHGNISTSNILFSSFDTPLLTDFSLNLKQISKHKEFVAPELQNENTTANKYTDIYSLGIVFDKLFGQNFQYPEQIHQMIKNMTSNDPNIRPTAQQLVETFIQNNFFGTFFTNEDYSKLFKPLLITDEIKSITFTNNDENANNQNLDIKSKLNNAYHYYTDRQKHHSFENCMISLDNCQDDPLGSYNLGLILSRGVIAHSDVQRSYEYFKKAADMNISEANIQIAKMIIRNELSGYKIADAHHFLQIAAQNGSAEANYQLGILTQNGYGVEPNSDAAANYYRLAAQGGHKEAQFQYGMMLQKGYDIQKNIKEAAELYKQSADKGDKNALNQYALMLKEGIGVDKNIKEAAKMFKTAADMDNFEAQNNFAIMLQLGQGVPKNLRLAAKYFEKAAKNGNPDAQSNYGWCLKVGAGVQKDIELATKYFKLSADGGSSVGHNYYGLSLLLGQGCQKSEKQAARQFKMSAELDDEFGLLNFGMALFDGIGVKQNYTNAAMFIKKSADKGNNQAQFFYANMLKDGIGVERNYPEAAKYYKLAADAGNNDAKFFYATILKNGLGMEKDEEEAEKYFSINLNEDDGTRFFNYNSYSSHSTKTNDLKAKYSSNKGNIKVQIDINKLLRNVDLGVDDQEAAKFIKMSADQGNVNAMALYSKLCGNEAEEMKYLKMAADQGHVESILKLRVLKNKLRPEKKQKRANELSTCSSALFKLDIEDKEDENVSPNLNVQFDLVIDRKLEKDEEETKIEMSPEEAKEAIDAFNTAADVGIPEAFFQLGRCYDEGIGVEVDKEKAVMNFKKSADLGHVDGCYKYALACFNGDGVPKNKVDAFDYFKKAAEQGHDLAKLRYAGILNDLGGKNNINLSASLFRELATMGYAEAMYQYACMLRDGRGVPVDYQRAAHYFLRCASINYSDSGLQYGILISEDHDIPFFITDVLNYFLMALKEKKSTNAKFIYGLMLTTGIGLKRNLSMGLGALNVSRHEKSLDLVALYEKKDKDRKIIALKNLADCNCVEAMYSYAMKMKERDIKEYIKYNKKASDVQFIPSMFEYGKSLFTGTGVEEDIQTGMNLITFAADSGIHEAQLFIGIERDTGEKIEQDVEEASKYYRNAMSGGIVEAIYRLAMMHLTGRDPKPDAKYGMKLLLEAVEKGYEDAMIQYAIQLHSGNIIEKDLEKSKSILTELANKQNQKAIELLNLLFPPPKQPQPEENILDKSVYIDENQSILKEENQSIINENESIIKEINESMKKEENDEEKIDEKSMVNISPEEEIDDKPSETIDAVASPEEENEDNQNEDEVKARDVTICIDNLPISPSPMKKKKRRLVRKGSEPSPTRPAHLPAVTSPISLRRPRRLSDDSAATVPAVDRDNDSYDMRSYNYTQSPPTSPSTYQDDDYPAELVPRARNTNFLTLTNQDVIVMGSQIFKLNPLERETSNFTQPSVLDFFGSQVFEVRKKAAKGSADEQLKLALLLLGTIDEEKDTVQENYDEAMQNLMLSSNKGNAFSIYLYNLFVGQLDRIKEKLQEAAAHFKSLAENGDAAAMFIYGLMLRNGFGVKQNLEGAVEYFRLAAKLGHADAAYNCGLMIRLGFGAKQDLPRAAYYYYTAALKKHVFAAYNLAILHSNGWGVSKNAELAAKYFMIAANGGDAAAQANLGLMYKNGIGVKKDIIKAVKYFRRSARQENATGQNNYALVLTEGWEGHEANPEKATIFFRYAAKQGNVSAMYNFALSLLNGVGVKKNPKRAVKVLALASREGDEDSQFKVGYILFKGDRIRKDPIRGLQYLAMAAKQGNCQAMVLIGRALKSGDFVGQNTELALMYFHAAAMREDPLGLLNYGLMKKDEEGISCVKKSADMGNKEAQCLFAVMLYSGKEIEQNINLAMEYIKKSADQGYENAIRLMKEWKENKMSK